MSFFDKIFNTDSSPQNYGFNLIETEDDLRAFEEKSDMTTVYLFKHSPRCGISSMILNQFKSSLPEELKNNVGLVNVVNQSELSRHLAQKYNVQHKSPQVLVLSGKKVVDTASHSGINQLQINRFK